ncbi:SusC/RagA family TonB-linked outer membrane protein [Sphingobacterium anhuiense]|uniref:SusC/RagA family TonB-linked outer membrane protein n=1 Tax=Sphingobacterium anhuiense TaxID=493780 RepID=UPI003C2DC5A9
MKHDLICMMQPRPLSSLLFFCLLSSYAEAQSFHVSGKVSDAITGNSLPGVTVKVKGSQLAAVTDKDGNYTINTKEESILVYSFVGYASLEIPVGKQTVVDVTLKKNDLLDEVVVIGYGTRSKKDLTGSVASVSANQIKDIPVSSIDQKLIGQLPGVQISSPTGAPGGGTIIKVRGSGSIGAGDNPLYVIDGFAISSTNGQDYNPLNSISPDNIENVTVLKDASSTAIYGSRGANGVIMITTKKGKSGAPVVAVNSYFGSQVIPQRGRPDVLNGTEYAQFQREIIEDRIRANGGVPKESDIPEAYRNPTQYGAGTNWYDAVLRTAMQNNVDASIRGGSQGTRYSFALGRLDQKGTILYTDYERYTFQSNIESDISKKVKVGLSFSPTGSVQHRNSFETGQRDVLTRTLWLSPIVPIHDANGNRTVFITSPGAIGAGNPLNTLEYASTKAKYLRGIATAFAQYEVINGLKFKYSFNVDYINNSNFVFRPSFVLGETGNPNPNPAIPSSSTATSTSLNWLSELTATYDKQLGDKHHINVLVGYTAQKERGEGYNFNAGNYPDNLIETINAATLINGQGAGIDKWSLLSYLARADYAYKGKYLLTGTVRRDGSSRFGADVRYGFFPSAAFAWRASEEDFLKDISWLNDLKLRTTYGRTGNFAIPNYGYASNISNANYSFGGQLAGGRVSTSIANNALTWENSNEFDLGFDLSLFGSRLNIVADYYNRITYDMLYNAEIPLASGFSNSIINQGKIRNRGLEFSISSQNIRGEFTWGTNFNISFNKNKVLALNSNNDPIYSGRSGEGNYTHKTEVGKPLGQFFGFVVDGVYRNQEDLDRSPKHASSIIGSAKYKDIDGNGIIEAVKDFAVIGNPQPDFTYGLTNTFSYKNFDLSVLLVGSQGGQIMKTANEFLTNIDGVFNVDRKILNRFRSPENPGDGVTPTTNGGRTLYREVNSGWIEDANYLKIQNITLGYDFKKILNNSKVIKGLRMYGTVQNLVTFTGYSGANPEATTNNSGVLTPGRDFISYPLPRIMTLGVNVTF